MYASLLIQEGKKKKKKTLEMRNTKLDKYIGLVKMYCIQTFIITVFRNNTTIIIKA